MQKPALLASGKLSRVRLHGRHYGFFATECPQLPDATGA
jgi:hypothetical protein